MNNHYDSICSYCGKSGREVDRLIAGPSVYICNECVDLCQDMIQEDKEKDSNWEGEVVSRQEADKRLEAFRSEREVLEVNFQRPEDKIYQAYSFKKYGWHLEALKTMNIEAKDSVSQRKPSRKRGRPRKIKAA